MKDSYRQEEKPTVLERVYLELGRRHLLTDKLFITNSLEENIEPPARRDRAILRQISIAGTSGNHIL